MVNNFEKETGELNEHEIKIVLPVIVHLLCSKKGKGNAITNKELQRICINRGVKGATGARIRKIIHHIRITGIVERLIATSSGYYITDDAGELGIYINSLHQRADSILSIAKQLDYQRKKLGTGFAGEMTKDDIAFEFEAAKRGAKQDDDFLPFEQKAKDWQELNKKKNVEPKGKNQGSLFGSWGW